MQLLKKRGVLMEGSSPAVGEAGHARARAHAHTQAQAKTAEVALWLAFLHGRCGWHRGLPSAEDTQEVVTWERHGSADSKPGGALDGSGQPLLVTAAEG